MNKRQERIVEKEVKRKLRRILYERAKREGAAFKKEFKKQLVVAISSAFGFLIALSWRDAIASSIQSMVIKMGVSEKIIYYQFLSAIIITILSVLGLIVVSKWASKSS